MDESVTPPGDQVERWLPVAGYRHYEVSSLGRVRSVDRTVPCLDGRSGRPVVKHMRGVVLRQCAGTQYGYLMVTLYQDKKASKRYVHQLVAEAFLGPRPSGQLVRHGPNGCLDNRASQLQYGTKADNSGLDRERDGTLPHGSLKPLAKLTEEQVAAARIQRASGFDTFASLAAEYGVSTRTMRDAVVGEGWRHVTGTPEIPQLNRSERNRLATLRTSDAIEIRERHAAGASKRALAKEFGVTERTITRVVTRRTWKDVA